MRKLPIPLLLFGAIWAAGLAVGFHYLMSYSGTPGEASIAQSQWPVGSHLPHTAGLAQLVLFAHPRCPCSRATLAELGRLLSQTSGRIQVTVVIRRPHGFSDEWAKHGIWEAAKALPGVTTLLDDGTETSRFGAKTSGQVFLYDQKGQLAFEGGITPSRGHEGHSLGHDAILALADRRPSSVKHSAVYGCSLEKHDLNLEKK